MRRLALILLLLLLVAPAPTDAQGNTHPCAGPLPFAVSDANRITGGELRTLLAGKTLQYLRRWRGPPPPSPTGRGLQAPPWYERLLTLEVRRDGSMLVRCEERPDAASTAFHECRAIVTGASGSAENGIWRIDGGLYCWTHTRVREAEEVCVSIHRQDGRYAAKRVRGSWTCLEGEFLFK